MRFSNYRLFNTSSILASSISVNEINTTSLVDALNAYVNANKNRFDCILSNWVEDTNNINNGYPIFEWQTY